MGRKLIIQIPCFNEEEYLGAALDALPKQVAGFDVVEILIINDGSTDRTAEVAEAWGVDHVISLPRNQGLAKAFVVGLKACLAQGADVIVNTDADNQYCAEDIPLLCEPILCGQAEFVVGARPIDQTEHFSWIKKKLQRLGSWMVRVLSDTDIPDAPSGFRAISRTAAMQLNVFSRFTYTVETIIQAGQKGIAIASMPIRINGKVRESRLFKSTPDYIFKSVLTMFRIFMVYRPMRFFMLLGSMPFGAGLLIGLRFLYRYLSGNGEGMIQSLLLATMLMGFGVMFFVVALLADLISVNRRLLESVTSRLDREVRG